MHANIGVRILIPREYTYTSIQICIHYAINVGAYQYILYVFVIFCRWIVVRLLAPRFSFGCIIVDNDQYVEWCSSCLSLRLSSIPVLLARNCVIVFIFPKWSIYYSQNGLHENAHKSTTRNKWNNYNQGREFCIYTEYLFHEPLTQHVV